MALDKKRILAALDTTIIGIAELDALRQETRAKLKALLPRLNAAQKEVSRQWSKHESPEGFFASDPDGDYLATLDSDLAPHFETDELLGLTDKHTWDSHLSIADKRDNIAAIRKKLA